MANVPAGVLCTHIENMFLIPSIRRMLLITLGLGACALAACGGGTAQVLKSGTPAERFNAGMQALEKEDYLEAQQFFNSIILQDPTSDFADDAQFYLAESYFRDGDYKLAAFNYNRFQTSFPNSPFLKLAQFRSGESYYNASPTYDRDQRETRYALDVFGAFVQIYGNDSLVTIAKSRIAELREKLAKKDFMTAELYVKMEDYRSALLYYARVADSFPGTDFAQRAMLAKQNAQHELDMMRASTDR